MDSMAKKSKSTEESEAPQRASTVQRGNDGSPSPMSMDPDIMPMVTLSQEDPMYNRK